MARSQMDSTLAVLGDDRRSPTERVLLDWNTPEVAETRRLIRKFFPESRATVHLDRPMGVYDLVTAMSWATDYFADFSCEPNPYLEAPPDLGLEDRGGVWDDDDSIYKRLLEHTGFSPTGRVVIIPDDYCTFDRTPIVCHSRTAIQRVREFSATYSGDSKCKCFFDNLSDIIFVYESGEAMVLDHDQRFFWAKSKLRSWTEEAANHALDRSDA
ncbi:hypothetical protein [Thalassoroseus pseudoceratinae]|uniref:hypothetical protein n=1 Tax=Thalassoroseus pseudoceratinae TaxID=2713176 RepID=UPI00141F4968|nr:hypothetical protein [Thalassoroseus pseudoceratinae]